MSQGDYPIRKYPGGSAANGTTETPPARRAAKRCFQGLVAIVVPLALLVGLYLLISHRPAFYVERLNAQDPEQQKALSRQFLNKLTRLISDMQNTSAWSAEFEESQVNAWLAQDFKANHAEESLPAGVREPRIAIEGEYLHLGFRYRKGPISTVVHIGFRAWVPKPNLLAIELRGASMGAVSLPTNQARQMIEQIASANGLEVSWKRNGGRLVALLEFSRSHRDVVLRKVDIAPEGISIRGINAGYSPNPQPDYAPSAN